MVVVTSVPPRLVPEVWERGAARWIEAALKVQQPATHNSDDVLSELLAEASNLWIAFDRDNPADPIDAAIVTVVQQFPQFRVYYMPWAGGRNLWKWAREFDRLTNEAALAHGCRFKTCGGRAGWRRFGYRPIGVMLMKDLRHG